jgi:hypothetical protein
MLSETRGFMKAVIDVDNNSILGVAMLGALAGEVVGVVQTAIWASLPKKVSATGSSPIQRSPKGSTRCSQKSQPQLHDRRAHVGSAVG